MGISAKEAAQRTGMSKAGIMKAIHTGKLSASKNLNGVWEIEPVELFRVYKPLTTEHSSVEVRTESVVTLEEHLRTQVALQQQVIEQQQARIHELTEQIQSQKQLEDKQAKLPPVEPVPTWWERLLRRG